MNEIAGYMPVTAMRLVARLRTGASDGITFKARLLGLIILVMISSPLLAVDCTPDSITLSTQSEVNDFQANHGPCDTIVGRLTVSGGDITDLSPLSGITTGALNSDIWIHSNPSLTSLDGLSGLVNFHILWIFNNAALTSISGLSSLAPENGALIIEHNPFLTNVAVLEGLTTLNGALILGHNDSLSDLSGLSNLSHIGASLSIVNNGSLTTLNSLSALEFVGASIGINENFVLTSIAGLSGVSGFTGWLSITGNAALDSLEGLSGITSLQGLRIRFNPLLTDLDNLSGVTSVGNIYSALEIDNNASLQNLDGLAALVSLDADLAVTNNPQLSQCSALATLLDDVDDALPGPGPGAAGIPDINGDVLLSGNLEGCNSIEEILPPATPSSTGTHFIAGEAEFLLKGFGITGGCLESIIRLPGPMTLQSRDLLLQCALQNYEEGETLVFRAADKSCRTLAELDARSVSYEFSIHAPHTTYSGSLQEVSDAMFLEDDTAFLALNLRTSELARVGTITCATPHFNPPGDDTTPPVVTAPEDIIGFEATAELTPVELGTATVVDDSGEVLEATPDNPGPFPLGDTVVTWSATDSSGNTGTDTQLVNVVDTTPPVVIAPGDISVPATGALTAVNIGLASATDNTGSVVSIFNDAPDAFEIGATTVVWTAMDASGNLGTDIQLVTVTPPQIVASYDIRPTMIDGELSIGEWSDATHFPLEHGTIAFKHDRERLYILINMLDDTGDDSFATGGGDQFWLYFDRNEDGVITPDVDFRFRLESGTGNLRMQTFCDGCPMGFNPLEPMTFSSRAEGFGCFLEDGSASVFPLTCNAHRLWELALDLGELGMRTDGSTQFGFLVSSGIPALLENLPSDLNEMSSYAALSLESSVTPFGSAPGAMNPLFEVTQAIQTTENAQDLVAGRPTAVRIWAPENDRVVRSFIHGSRNGIDLPGSPILSQSRLFSSLGPTNPRDSIVWNSFTALPEPWSAGGTVDFKIIIQGMDGSLVPIPDPLVGSISFVPTRTPVFWTVPIRNVFPDFAFTEASGALIGQAEDWLRQMAPIQNITIVRRPVLTVNNVTTSSQLKEILNNYDQATIITWLQGAMSGTPPFVLPEQTTGFTATSIAGISGSSDRIGKGGRGRITWAAQSTNPASMTYIHELNHNLDRASTSTWGLHAPGCNSQSGGPVDANWPYGNSFTIQDTGVAPAGANFRSMNNQTPDFMSYCIAGTTPRQWWSPYRWQAWVDEFRTDTTSGNSPSVSPLEAAFPGAGDPEDSFHILGRVYPDGTGEIVQVLRDIGLPDPISAGLPFQVDVRNCSGSLLSTNTFEGSFTDDEGEEEEFISFSMVVPAPAQACTIELLVNLVPADALTISSAEPEIEVVSPNGGEVWGGMETIQWSASHPDGASLKFTVLYSPDDGTTWQMLGGLIDDQELEVDFGGLATSEDARIRVYAAAGGMSAFDDSDESFHVEGTTQLVEILSPADGTVVSSEQPLLLAGRAMDASGETVAGENLLWWVNGEPAATGESASVYLAEGNHTAELMALEDGEVLASSTVEFDVSSVAGSIGFSQDMQVVGEDSGEATLTVKRSGGVAGPATVFYSTMDDTAISGGDPALGEDDYVEIAPDPLHRLEWMDGDSAEATISVLINPDDVPEPPERFFVLLTPLDQEILNPDVASMIIRDEAEFIFEDGFE